jgi:hypothetical protein
MLGMEGAHNTGCLLLCVDVFGCVLHHWPSRLHMPVYRCVQLYISTNCERFILLRTAVCCCVPQPWPNNDLLVQYNVWRDSITAVVQVEPPAPESFDTQGTFVLSVMPPGPERSVCFRRDVIFVFDRSGSMTGG